MAKVNVPKAQELNSPVHFPLIAALAFTFSKPVRMYCWVDRKSKKKINDQELIQSNPTSHPQNRKGRKHTYKKINIHKGTRSSKPNEQLFPKQVAIQLR